MVTPVPQVGQRDRGGGCRASGAVDDWPGLRESRAALMQHRSASQAVRKRVQRGVKLLDAWSRLLEKMYMRAEGILAQCGDNGLIDSRSSRVGWWEYKMVPPMLWYLTQDADMRIAEALRGLPQDSFCASALRQIIRDAISHNGPKESFVGSKAMEEYGALALEKLVRVHARILALAAGRRAGAAAIERSGLADLL